MQPIVHIPLQMFNAIGMVVLVWLELALLPQVLLISIIQAAILGWTHAQLIGLPVAQQNQRIVVMLSIMINVTRIVVISYVHGLEQLV